MEMQEHIPHPLHRLAGEKAIKQIMRARLWLWIELSIPVLLLAVVITVAFLLSSIASVMIMAFLSALALIIWILWIYMQYKKRIVCMLTDRRIVYIERGPLLIGENRTELQYDNVREVDVIVEGAFQQFFDIGEVSIHIPGTQRVISLKPVEHPFDIQEEIYALRDHFKH